MSRRSRSPSDGSLKRPRASGPSTRNKDQIAERGARTPPHGADYAPWGPRGQPVCLEDDRRNLNAAANDESRSLTGANDGGVGRVPLDQERDPRVATASSNCTGVIRPATTAKAAYAPSGKMAAITNGPVNEP